MSVYAPTSSTLWPITNMWWEEVRSVLREAVSSSLDLNVVLGIVDDDVDFKSVYGCLFSPLCLCALCPFPFPICPISFSPFPFLLSSLSSSLPPPSSLPHPRPFSAFSPLSPFSSLSFSLSPFGPSCWKSRKAGLDGCDGRKGDAWLDCDSQLKDAFCTGRKVGGGEDNEVRKQLVWMIQKKHVRHAPGQQDHLREHFHFAHVQRFLRRQRSC